MEQIEMPRFTDDPPTVLLWSIDELVPLIAGLVLGMQAGQALFFTTLGFLCMHIYRKYMDRSPDGYILHMLYWHGFSLSSGRTVPNPFIREWC